MSGCQSYGRFSGTLNTTVGAVLYRDPNKDHNYDSHPYTF